MQVINGFSNQLEYRSFMFENAKNKPTLVFLHEALGSIEQFKSFPYNLCSTLELNGVIYNRSGHGYHSNPITNRSADYLSKYTDELAAFINDLNLATPFILVGHSDGGSIGLEFAARYPELGCVACIALAAHVINEPITRKGIQKAMHAYEMGKLNGLIKYHGTNTEALVLAWSNTWQSTPFKKWEIVSLLHQINIPVLAIQGQSDQYGTSKQLELIDENIPHSVVYELENIGHHPHIEDEKQVIEILTNWLKNVKLINEQTPTLGR